MNAINPKYKEEVQESFTRQDFMTYIGAELVSISPGECEIKLPFNKNLTQQHGYFHAGAVATMGDNATGYAAYSLMEASSSVLTVEYKINLMAPAKGDYIIARGKVIRNGRTLKICQAKIYAITNKEEKLCALLQSTIMEMRNTKDS